MKVETIFSQAAVQIVVSPFLVGKELEELALAASQDFVRSLPSERLAQQPPPVSLEILNGGRYYFVRQAYESVTENKCSTATLRAKRGSSLASQDLPSGTELWCSEGSEWCVRIWDVQQLLPGPLLVGDTVATGTTLAGVLGWVVAKMEASGSVHDIFVFTIAGSAEWEKDGGVLKKLAPIDEALQRHGCELHITYANAKFALQDNGTDLNPCPSMGAQIEPQARDKMEQMVGADFLKSMKCAIWDWGDRFTKPLEHLEEVEAYFSAQQGCPEYITKGIADSIARVRAEQAQSPTDANSAVSGREEGTE